MLAIKDRLNTLLFAPHVAYVSSYPPRECGIASFTRDVVSCVDKLVPLGRRCVVAVNDDDKGYAYPALVKHQIERDVASSYDDAAAYVNASPSRVINIQHEYGLFGGLWGADLLRFMDGVRQPIALTMHTVLHNPDPVLLSVTQGLIARSATTIVLAQSAIDILTRDYGVDAAKLRFIPHGVPDVRRVPEAKAKRALGLDDRTILATCGLMNPGKGIQYAIDALAMLVEEFPDVLYLVVGETHPGVLAASGEAYRRELHHQVRRLGLDKHVRFENRYLSYRELVLHLLATDVYVVPYLNLKQVVSGTLAYAMGCGRAIVSTPSMYATEVLAGGRGELAAVRDASSLSAAIGRILRDPVHKSVLQQQAYSFGHQMTWPNVARAYVQAYEDISGSDRATAKNRAPAQVELAAVPAVGDSSGLGAAITIAR
ncbi:MAG TPA: glycosyltransferase family 4 protein [Chloroflexota bacterium]|nr:glycosyltransferase family 4 protein [Chloroflexota bacterium]